MKDSRSTEGQIRSYVIDGIHAYTSKICLHSVNYILKHRFAYGTYIQAIPQAIPWNYGRLTGVRDCGNVWVRGGRGRGKDNVPTNREFLGFH